jgi:hypothetical protein
MMANYQIIYPDIFSMPIAPQQFMTIGLIRKLICRTFPMERNAMYVPMLLRDSAAEIKRLGKEEGKLEVARNLLVNGVSPDVIMKSTGLPQEKIRELMN